MNVAEIVLLGIALAMIGEALWGCCRPESMRRRVRTMLDESGIGDNTLHRFFWTLALLLWALAWTGQGLAQRTLFMIGVVCMLAGFWGQRPGAVKQWYNAVLGNRSTWTIRLIYLGEGLVAAGLIAIALRGA